MDFSETRSSPVIFSLQSAVYSCFKFGIVTYYLCNETTLFKLSRTYRVGFFWIALNFCDFSNTSSILYPLFFYPYWFKFKPWPFRFSRQVFTFLTYITLNLHSLLFNTFIRMFQQHFMVRSQCHFNINTLEIVYLT